MNHTLPNLPYPYNALEPFIDAQTMEIHHTKHHAGYVKNLNDALQNHSNLQEKPLEELVTSLGSLPESIRTAVRNNGGGHYNHSLFWQMMASPGQTGEPAGLLLGALEQNFGSLAEFKEQFAKSALGRFGSGWAWLTKDSNSLKIVSTANQDNPLTENKNAKILLGLDVWEHSYYLKYQNRRADYITAWWNIVNWREVDKNLRSA